ncbi:DUF1330 domain-containing protein [Gordonia rubripertincta]|uniref:DUF1330 domain-containing protein n=1 Tax=Gordonia rubripertincta TaxID=36822 RepID=A0ABT4MVK9_GORRU|nr:DUF1330 domain-containing protein [Gordonia rubripertincta]MCZ4551045.1 DUF1330 domain-containing protein [Gordonia rubripertincta]
MSVYFLAVVHKVRDADVQGEYGRRSLPHLSTCDATLVSAAFDTTGESGRIYEVNPGFRDMGIRRFETLEGEHADGVSFLKFPDREAFEAWYYSDEYQEVMKLRLEATEGQAFYVEGFE